ncbi:Alpha/beta knot methyltransferase [Dunaliella salina]|uniref:Alpha/beta knot methyltransferase n=1 Tax=Dunaliella salina TaxID=3046 RepID=A0ABQ7GXC1_DUNSA|nr:Alpha/beta knot methyltransferase [Dunaliella salina]|eukprot:KAF5839255.1 Alpha/beta knot methyltransferase [Dunaliella salina]
MVCTFRLELYCGTHTFLWPLAEPVLTAFSPMNRQGFVQSILLMLVAKPSGLTDGSYGCDQHSNHDLGIPTIFSNHNFWHFSCSSADAAIFCQRQSLDTFNSFQVQQGLVVVASLLDNVPNQAGLCRTCESLSVEALVLPNRAVVATNAFKKQVDSCQEQKSVTSERWLRLLEVSPRDVATFLQERKACGYTIIGIEQATNSIPLQAYTFPRAAVVLLGNEQSGIPAPLLHLLDVCVEIPTLGVTRSMNAHVCGALVTWQYTQQWLAPLHDAHVFGVSATWKSAQQHGLGGGSGMATWQYSQQWLALSLELSSGWHCHKEHDAHAFGDFVIWKYTQQGLSGGGLVTWQYTQQWLALSQ